MDGDTVRIYATCDSLAALLEYYERQISRIRNDTESRTDVESKSETTVDVFSPIKLLLTGFAAGIIFTVIVLLIIKKRQ